MPEAARSSDLGRCPACGQLVTLPPHARERKVGCPKCGHQAQGAVFGPLAAPLAVILVSRGEGSADEAPTHLLLGPLDLEDADDAKAAVEPDESPTQLPNADAGVGTGAGTDDARTRLMLGPLSVRNEQQTLFGRLLTLLGSLVPPALRWSVRLEEALHGRWLWVWAAIAVGCGFVAPLLDYLSTSNGATLGGISWLFIVSSLGLVGLARLNGMRHDDGRWDPRIIGLRAQAGLGLLLDRGEHWDRSPRHARLWLVGQLLALLGLVGFAWAGLVSSGRLLVGLGGAETSLPFVSGLLLLGAVVVLRRALASSPEPSVFLQDFGNAMAAAAELPPVLDLNDPLPAPVATGTTGLHESLRALARWHPRQWPDESTYRAALQQHLERHLPGAKLERERWMGASRLDGVVDLVINGMIVLGVKRGFDMATAERAVGQMRRYARTWSGKPLVLVLLEAPREAVFDGPGARLLVDARNEFVLLTVRMPTH
jgi:hypothetical protein